jgi:hypothetical protein
VPDARIAVVQIHGNDYLAARFERSAAGLGSKASRTVRRIGRRAERVLSGVAPKDTRRLADSIVAKPSFRADSARVTVEAGAMREGFSYLDVTRFGHRTPVITAKKGRFLKVYTMGRRFPQAVIFTPRVHGARPAMDWVAKGLPVIDEYARQEAGRLGREIVVEL